MTDGISAKQFIINQIKTNRTKRGWSQAKLAELVGVGSTSTVGNWEAGLATPDYDKLCFLADLFEVTTDQLLGRNTKVAEADNQESDSTIDIDNPDNKMMYECCDEIGRASIDNCVRFHYNRCISVPEVKSKSSFASRREKIFLDPDDAEYDVMRQQMTYLKKLRKNNQKGYMDITKYLWDLGYGGEICLAFVLNMFGIGPIKRVPGQRLYDDIEAYLKGNYAVVPNVKNI